MASPVAWIGGPNLTDLFDHMREHQKVRPISKKAFTLVELTIAIGVMGFALIAVVGVLPIGLSAHRKAVDSSVSSQIVQRVITDLQQANLNSLGLGVNQLQVRYFDDQGIERLAATESGVIYHVAPGVIYPAPLSSGSAPNLAQVIIDIAYNPGNESLTRDSTTGAFDPGNVIPSARFPAYVAHN